jgi:putative tricarboxylic transport membrane protein
MTTTIAPTDVEPRAVSPLREAALGLVFLAIGVVLFVLTRQIELPQRETAVSSRIWPEALAVGVIGLSLLQVVLAFSRPQVDDENEPATRVGVLRVTGFVIAVLAFGLLWYYVHFLLSGFVLVAALTWIAGGRGIKDLAIFPAIVTAVLYAIFALLLKVPV